MATCPSIDGVIGTKVRGQRMAFGFSVSRLADALGISELRLARIERGLTRIKATEMKGMCSIFNIPPSYFFAAWEIQGVPKSNASPPLDDAI